MAPITKFACTQIRKLRTDDKRCDGRLERVSTCSISDIVVVFVVVVVFFRIMQQQILRVLNKSDC